jgi:hypothetical protein
MSSSPVIAAKPSAGKCYYTKAQTFDRPALLEVPEEDDGLFECDAATENDHIRHLIKQIDAAEAILARAVAMGQEAWKVPTVKLLKKAPKSKPDCFWTCSQCHKEHFDNIASHLVSYHSVGFTEAEWKAKRSHDTQARAASVSGKGGAGWL